MPREPSYEELKLKVRELEAKQVQYENLLQENEFKKIFFNLQDIYVETSLDGIILEISPSIERYSKNKRTDIIGSSFVDFYFDPAERKQFLDSILKKGNVNDFELSLKDAEGNNHLFSANSALVRDKHGKPKKIIDSLHNITERKRSEIALQNSRDLLFNIMNGIESTIYVADMETHEILFMNKYMQDMFGKDLTGEICWKALRNESSPCSFCSNEKLLDKDGKPTEGYVWEDKNPITKQWTVKFDRAIKWIDGRYVRLQVATDITEAKELEKARLQMETRLHQVQKMEAIGTLAGGIAHDFNNILSSILGFTQLALEDAEKGSVLEDDLKEIYKASNRAKDLVKQILTFSRQDKEEDHMPVRVSTIAKETLKLLRASIPSSIAIQENILTRSRILGDPSQIHQIFMNLCTNASQAMDEQGTLTITLEDVMLEDPSAQGFHGIDPGKYLAIYILDTGLGISPAILDQIFEPYFTTKKLGKGTGMGLATVHGIVKNHGGEILVESKPGKGSCFTIYFPIIESDTKAVKKVPEHIQPGTERILFVDDEPPIIKMASKMMEWMGYKVSSRSSSLDALELFRSKPDDFDLVMTDMTMPHMTGDSLAREIMKIRSDIPIILCTGYSNKITEEQAKEIGIKGFVMKPVVKEDLAKMIRRVLDGQKEKQRTGSILVIDDDPQIRLMLTQILGEKGFFIETASNGEEGVQAFRKNPSDLIITDLVMPEKEGIEVILELKKDFPKVKIIAISGGGKNPAEVYLKMAGMLGAAKTFSKPFDVREILLAVQELMDK
jgi:PAS domain S-box-containing protein